MVITALFLTTGSVYAQGKKEFKDGSVWVISFIKTKAGMGDDYLKSLKSTWVAIHDEAVKQGLLVSYKVLSGNASGPNDYDMMLLMEYKNLAAMEGSEEKWDAIRTKVVGTDEAMKTLMQNRVSMRELYGERVMREVVFK